MKIKNIILIRPRIEIIHSFPNPPIGLGYIASYLEQNGFTVTILDLAIISISDNDLITFLKKKEPVFVGVTALSAYYNGMKKICKLIRQEYPRVPIVIGGVHPTALPEQSLEETGAHFVVIGEGEKTALELAVALENKSEVFEEIHGLLFKREENLFKTPPRELIDNLDDIPRPAWHKINPNKYLEPCGSLMRYTKHAPIFTSRGCPQNCHYCASCRFWHQKIRFRNPIKVVDEIQYLHEKFGIKEIHIWDDNLTLNKRHVTAICKEIIRRGLNKLVFSTPNGVQVTTLDENVLKLMKAAGFYCLTFAAESSSEKLLKMNGKIFNVKKVLENAWLAKKMGFHLNFTFMIGFPGETEENIKQTLRYARAFPHGMKYTLVLKPLPGSKIFYDYIKEQELKNIRWENVHFFNGKLNVSPFSTERLEYWQRKALFQDLLHIVKLPQYLFFRYIKYGHLSQIKVMLKRFIFLLFNINKDECA